MEIDEMLNLHMAGRHVDEFNLRGDGTENSQMHVGSCDVFDSSTHVKGRRCIFWYKVLKYHSVFWASNALPSVRVRLA